MEIYTALMLVFLIMIVAVLCLFVVKQKRLIKSLEATVSRISNKFEIVQQDISALSASGLGVDERVGGAERRVRSLMERIEELEESETFEHLQEFQEAIEMATKGAEVEEIVEKCHLTVDEADLLIRLHKP